MPHDIAESINERLRLNGLEAFPVQGLAREYVEDASEREASRQALTRAMARNAAARARAAREADGVVTD